jgi:VanZ family protein
MTGAARACGWLGVATIAVLSLVPGSARPHVLPVSQLEHVAAYCATAAALAWGYPGRRNLLTVGLLLSAYAAMLEAGQLWVPGRTAQLIDAAAGALGAWIGISLAVALRLAWPAARPGPT